MNLTMREDMHFGRGKELATDPMGYEVLGLPAGKQAFVRKDPRAGWYLLVSVSESPLERRGDYESAEAALADLEHGAI